MGLRFVMLGDIVGQPGRRVVQQQLPALREQYGPDLVIANAENAAGGSGLTPAMYRKLLRYGVDGVTLGDHVFRQMDIVQVMDQAANLVRPANLPNGARGARWMKLTTADGLQHLYVVTLLGRLYMSPPLGDDPFATIDALLDDLPWDAPVVVEIHAEATSEKRAMAYHLDGRVAAVIGTHTHVPTADAMILPRGSAYITDLGMCGPFDSIIGRDVQAVLHYMTTGMPRKFAVAKGDVRLCGVLVELDDSNRAIRCERIEVPADTSAPPFDQADDEGG
jgi:hypothetical protein